MVIDIHTAAAQRGMNYSPGWPFVMAGTPTNFHTAWIFHNSRFFGSRYAQLPHSKEWIVLHGFPLWYFYMLLHTITNITSLFDNEKESWSIWKSLYRTFCRPHILCMKGKSILHSLYERQKLIKIQTRKEHWSELPHTRGGLPQFPLQLYFRRMVSWHFQNMAMSQWCSWMLYTVSIHSWGKWEYNIPWIDRLN